MIVTNRSMSSWLRASTQVRGFRQPVNSASSAKKRSRTSNPTARTRDGRAVTSPWSRQGAEPARCHPVLAVLDAELVVIAVRIAHAANVDVDEGIAVAAPIRRIGTLELDRRRDLVLKHAKREPDVFTRAVLVGALAVVRPGRDRGRLPGRHPHNGKRPAFDPEHRAQNAPKGVSQGSRLRPKTLKASRSGRLSPPYYRFCCVLPKRRGKSAPNREETLINEGMGPWGRSGGGAPQALPCASRAWPLQRAPRRSAHRRHPLFPRARQGSRAARPHARARRDRSP